MTHKTPESGSPILTYNRSGALMQNAIDGYEKFEREPQLEQMREILEAGRRNYETLMSGDHSEDGTTLLHMLDKLELVISEREEKIRKSPLKLVG